MSYGVISVDVSRNVSVAATGMKVMYEETAILEKHFRVIRLLVRSVAFLAK